MTAIRVAVAEVPIDEIEPNDWNPNQQDERTAAKLRESIETFGVLQPLVGIRLTSGRIRILNGEHSWTAAKAGGAASYPVNVIGTEAEVSPARQRQITLALNRIHGEHDRELEARVVEEIWHYAAEDEVVVLPFSESYAADLVSQHGGYVADELAATPRTHERHIAERRGAPGAREQWETIAFTMPASALAVVRQAFALARDAGAGDDDWQCLEALAADYLGGLGGEEEPDAEPPSAVEGGPPA